MIDHACFPVLSVAICRYSIPVLPSPEAAALLVTTYSRVEHAGKTYCINGHYVFQTREGTDVLATQLGRLHNISLCNTTEELYFHVLMYEGDMEKVDGFMPCLKLPALSKSVQILPYHRTISIEPIVVYHLPNEQAAFLVRC